MQSPEEVSRICQEAEERRYEEWAERAYGDDGDAGVGCAECGPPTTDPEEAAWAARSRFGAPMASRRTNTRALGFEGLPHAFHTP